MAFLFLLNILFEQQLLNTWIGSSAIASALWENIDEEDVSL